MPSAVRPGPVHRSSASRAARASSTCAVAVSASGSTSHLARRTGDEDGGAVPELEQAGHADHAGDAELAGDDRGVAGGAALLGHQRDHGGRVEPCGVGRRQVLGDQHRGPVGHGHAGLRLADQTGGHPALDVAQVGHPLGHQATHRREDAGELLDRGVQRDEEGVPGRQPLLDRRPQALVAGQPGGGGEHLGGGAAGAVGAGGQPLGRGTDRDVVRRESRVGVGEAGGLEGRDRGRGHRDGGGDDRGVGDAGDDRGSAKDE